MMKVQTRICGGDYEPFSGASTIKGMDFTRGILQNIKLKLPLIVPSNRIDDTSRTASSIIFFFLLQLIYTTNDFTDIFPTSTAYTSLA
jgi:hypothetical protein